MSMVSSKRMTLKRSEGFRRPSAYIRLAFACAIEVPPMEPELSITNTISRGRGFSSAGTAGGVTKASR